MALAIPAGSVSVQISFFTNAIAGDFATATVYLITTPAVANALASNGQLLDAVLHMAVGATPPGNTTPPTHFIQIQVIGPMPAGHADYVPWRSMREQGLDLPLAAAPAKLIAASHLPQGDLVVTGAIFTRDQSEVCRSPSRVG